MCIFAPGQQVKEPKLPLTDPDANNPNAMQCSTVYANVNKGFLPANGAYTIPQWRDTKTDQPATLINYFKTKGTYTVIVAVDYYVSKGDVASGSFPRGYVDEGVKGEENNNVSQAYTFTV